MNAGARMVLRRLILGAALCGAPATAAVGTAEILTRSADLDCLEYRAVGGCLWLTCVGTYCTTASSIKYRHFVPEAVVTGYASVEAHPWRELGGILRPARGYDGGTAAKGGSARGSTSYRVRMAEVVGSPGVAWIEALDLGTTVCEPQSAALTPYYVSMGDPVWRVEEVQTPWTLRHLWRLIKGPGLLGAVWGPVYPRAGAVQQPDGRRAAAVVAQRAADLVTRRRQWIHVYRPLAGGDGVGQWGPPPVREGVEGNHKWQMVSPAKGRCGIFGAEAGGGARGVRDVAESYAWNLWRPYECCARRGTFLIGDW